MANFSLWTANQMLAHQEEILTLTPPVDQGGVRLQLVAVHLSQAGHRTHIPNHEHQLGMLHHVHPILTRIAAHQRGMRRLGHQIHMRMVGVHQRGMLARGHQTHMRQVRMRARSVRVGHLHGVVQLLEGMRAGGRPQGGRLLVMLQVIGIVVRGSRLQIRVLGEMLPVRMVGGVRVPLQLQVGILEEVG